MNGDELMRYYDYSPKLARFIRLLTAEDCKKLFILSHSMNLLKKHQLLKKSLSTTITTKSQIDGEIFFVSGIVQVVQSIKTWQNASCEGISTTRQAIRTTTIRSVINDPALNANNCIDLPNLDDVDEVNDETAKVNKIKDCYYPWYDTTILSSRALSLILLKIICQASNTIGMEAYKSLRVLLLQVVEGLSDRYTRNLFLVQKSNTTKRALAKWKRDIKMNRVRLHLRPILTNEEMDWVINALHDLTYEEDCEAILNSFATPTSNNTPLYTYY
ncbi:hypothetical protein BJ944DRAFT_291391 [Cunninghamella echinulata]|nr:hypothetical protein BJ944DRAFT_291391 [Cunninghamella echinulata]